MHHIRVNPFELGKQHATEAVADWDKNGRKPIESRNPWSQGYGKWAIYNHGFNSTFKKLLGN